MEVQVASTAVGEFHITGGDDPLPPLPKMAAVGRAYKAALEFGLPDGFASALSHSVVDPAALSWFGRRSSPTSPTPTVDGSPAPGAAHSGARRAPLLCVS